MNDVKPKIWSKDFVLIILVNFCLFTAFQMTLPTLPIFIQEIGASDQWIGIVVGIFTFSALLIRPRAGRLIDSAGRRPIFLLGLLLFVISMFSLAASFTIFLLIFVRIIQGIGWGLSSTASGTIASDLIPRERRGEGLGYYGLSANVALAFGPALGLYLTNHVTFPVLFSICGALGIISVILAMNIKYVSPEKKNIKDVKRSHTPRFDVLERSALSPSILLFFITFTFGGISSFLPLYTFQLGFDPIYIQLYFVVFALFLILSRMFAGRLYDKHGVAIVFIPGTFLIFTAMILLAILPGPIYLLIASALYGLGFGCIQPALQAWAVNNAKPERRGMANATYFSAFDLGVGIGAMTFGVIAELFTYHAIYYTSAVSVGISLLLFIFLFSNNNILFKKTKF